MRGTSRALPLVVVAACEGSQSALDPRGRQAAEIYELWNVMLIGGAVIFTIVVTLALVATLLPRRDEVDLQRRRHLVAGGAITTAVILVVLVVYNADTSRALTATPHDPIHVRVLARQWWWDITYVGASPGQGMRTANELRIPVGRPVAIELASLDVIHSFWVPNLHGKTDAIPGRTTRLWLQADEPGIYRGQCAEFCGLQHAKMAFVVHALPPAEYAAWYAAELAPATPPAGALAARGQEVFFATCAKCHAIRGTLALAAAGPDLTHLASRHALAAGTLPNRRGALAGWVLDPQHVKPGAFMPAMELAADDLHALLHYLETLR